MGKGGRKKFLTWADSPSYMGKDGRKKFLTWADSPSYMGKDGRKKFLTWADSPSYMRKDGRKKFLTWADSLIYMGKDGRMICLLKYLCIALDKTTCICKSIGIKHVFIHICLPSEMLKTEGKPDVCNISQGT